MIPEGSKMIKQTKYSTKEIYLYNILYKRKKKNVTKQIMYILLVMHGLTDKN